MIDMQKTGMKIKGVCERRGFSIREIQDALHIGAYQSVYNWFRGKTLPSVDNLYELSGLLNVPMDSLIVGRKEAGCLDMVSTDYVLFWGEEDFLLEMAGNVPMQGVLTEGGTEL